MLNLTRQNYIHTYTYKMDYINFRFRYKIGWHCASMLSKQNNNNNNMYSGFVHM